MFFTPLLGGVVTTDAREIGGWPHKAGAKTHTAFHHPRKTTNDRRQSLPPACQRGANSYIQTKGLFETTGIIQAIGKLQDATTSCHGLVDNEVHGQTAMTGKLAATIMSIWLCGAYAMAAEGLITLASNFGPKDTMDRLETEIAARGMTVFARIDHAAGAAQVGLPLRPTALLIFGSAKGGTPLMQSDQAVGIDLPLKALVWEDAAGRTWLSYNDAGWVAKGRHGLGAGTDRTIDGLTATLSAVARKATEGR